MKTWICNSVFLPDLPDKHRGNNNNAQCSIVIRAKTKKRVAEILNCSAHTLREFYGCHEAGPSHVNIPRNDERVYYNPGACKSGYINEWFEYIPLTKR